MGIFNWLFGSKNKSDLNNKSVDYDDKKHNLDIEVSEDIFYVHDEPDLPNTRGTIMPRVNSETQADYVDTQSVMIADGNGERQMSTADAANRMEKHAPGVMVPGLGMVGGANNPKAAPRPQARPQAAPRVRCGKTRAGCAQWIPFAWVDDQTDFTVLYPPRVANV